jgi:CubicO group peptidase (beta-lactamase class C family)
VLHPSTGPGVAPFPRTTPEEQGVPSSALLRLVRRWEAAGLEPHSLMVLRHGHVVAEGWWAPYRPDGVQLVYSVSKTFTACAVGFAVDEGLLRLEERVVDLFPEAAGVAGPRARALTLHDLLAMRTGHRADTLTWRGVSPTEFPATFLAAEPEEDRGWFVYHNGATLMAALAVQRRTGGRLLDYLRPRLLDPLGTGDVGWQQVDGYDLGFSGLHVPTDALAGVGELLLRDGVRDGRRVLPAGWVDLMTTVHTDTSHHPETTDWQQGYGYQVWRCTHDAWRADGAFGQFAVVVPGADLVVALTSCTDRTQETLDALWHELLPAVADAPLPADPDAHRALDDALAEAALATPRSAVAPSGDGPWTYSHWPTDQVPALAGVEVTRALSGGWRLTVLEGDARHEVPCGDGSWPDASGLAWVAAGGWTARGVFEAVVVAVGTPHALALRCESGRVAATWNAEPLGWSALTALVAPT